MKHIARSLCDSWTACLYSCECRLTMHDTYSTPPSHACVLVPVCTPVCTPQHCKAICCWASEPVHQSQAGHPFFLRSCQQMLHTHTRTRANPQTKALFTIATAMRQWCNTLWLRLRLRQSLSINQWRCNFVIIWLLVSISRVTELVK